MAAAETHTIKVTQEDGEEVTLKIDGTTEVINLNDLADGEERVVAAGEHEFKVRRQGSESFFALRLADA